MLVRNAIMFYTLNWKLTKNQEPRTKNQDNEATGEYANELTA